MSVYQLTAENFGTTRRGNKNILTINVPGTVLIFFKMDSCSACGALLPVFHQLANEDRRVTCAIVNLSTQRKVAQMAQYSTTPIRKVPSLLLYHNSRPKARYNGTKSIIAIKSFLNKVLSRIPQTQQPQMQTKTFVPQQQQQTGMYGSGGYRHPQLAPGHSGFNGNLQRNNSQQKVYKPEGLKMPTNMGGIVKNGSQTQYAYLNDVDEEDDEKLELPNHVTPHNVPWLNGYKKMGTLD